MTIPPQNAWLTSPRRFLTSPYLLNHHLGFEMGIELSRWIELQISGSSGALRKLLPKKAPPRDDNIIKLNIVEPKTASNKNNLKA